MKILIPVFAFALVLGACSQGSTPEGGSGAGGQAGAMGAQGGGMAGAMGGQDGAMGGQGGGMGGDMGSPPPEAFEACNGKSEGSSCSVENTPQGTITGTCGSVPNVEGMLCIPEGGIPGG